jgi:hypothetical protein
MINLDPKWITFDEASLAWRAESSRLESNARSIIVTVTVAIKGLIPPRSGRLRERPTRPAPAPRVNPEDCTVKVHSARPRTESATQRPGCSKSLEKRFYLKKNPQPRPCRSMAVSRNPTAYTAKGPYF